MTTVNCMMAGALDNVMQFLPYIFAGLCVAIILIAFFRGFAKGFRKIGWWGLVWIGAGVAFFVLAEKFGVNNPVKNLLSGQTEAIASLGANLALALGCVLLALVLYGLATLLFRPKTKLVAKHGDRYFKDENGIEYDDETEDYDDYLEYQSEEILVKKGYYPSFLGRLFGGLVGAINVISVLVAIFAVALLIIDCTPLKDFVSALYALELNSVNVMEFAMVYVSDYALDFIFIGVVIAVACKGRDKGFLESLRFLVVKLGGWVIGIGAFVLPFSQFAQAEGGVYLFSEVVAKCVEFSESLSLSGAIADIVGKLFAGLLTFAVSMIAIALLNFLLKTLSSIVDGIGLFRTLDKSLSCVAYVVIGAVVCALVWAGLYLLNFYGLLNTSAFFSANATISTGLFEAFDEYLKPLLENLGEQIKGLFASFGI